MLVSLQASGSAVPSSILHSDRDESDHVIHRMPYQIVHPYYGIRKHTYFCSRDRWDTTGSQMSGQKHLLESSRVKI